MTDKGINAQVADDYLGAAVGSGSVTDWQRDHDAKMGQAYAVLALADAVDRLTQQVVASTEYVTSEIARGRG